MQFHVIIGVYVFVSLPIITLLLYNCICLSQYYDLSQIYNLISMHQQTQRNTTNNKIRFAFIYYISSVLSRSTVIEKLHRNHPVPSGLDATLWQMKAKSS